MTGPVVVRAPAKVNLQLVVGGPEADGYHDLATVFHAVDLHDEVVAEPADEWAVEVLAGPDGSADGVPSDGTNLALRAARLLAEHVGGADPVRLTVRKRIPVAGGMAGGSADAAAALLACDLLWGAGLDRAQLHELAARLGADVPFALTGGTALGTGRGDRLSPVLARGDLHWVVALATGGLATPSVYAEVDRLRAGRVLPEPRASDALLQALRGGDPVAVARHLVNDLQPAAVSLRPELGEVLTAFVEAGALGAVVSGSGPTVVGLARDAGHAAEVAGALARGPASPHLRDVLRTRGPVHGARVVEAVGR